MSKKNKKKQTTIYFCSSSSGSAVHSLYMAAPCTSTLCMYLPLHIPAASALHAPHTAAQWTGLIYSNTLTCCLIKNSASFFITLTFKICCPDMTPWRRYLSPNEVTQHWLNPRLTDERPCICNIAYRMSLSVFLGEKITSSDQFVTQFPSPGSVWSTRGQAELPRQICSLINLCEPLNIDTMFTWTNIFL